MEYKYNKVVDWEEFRKYGHELIDYIADYYKNIDKNDVQPNVQPGFLKDILPEEAPNKSEEFPKIMEDFNKYILPGVTHWQHPNFYAYFPANSTPPSIFAEMLSKMLNSMSFCWASCPSSTELEKIVLNWLAKCLDLPKYYLFPGNGGGVLLGGASEGTLNAILSARDKSIDDNKCTIDKLKFYCSEQSHSGIIKGFHISGILDENITIIPTIHPNYKLDHNYLLKIINKDINDCYIPCFISVCLGSTASGSYDDLTLIGPICKEYNIWLHVDAAYAGSALICPELRYMSKGLEYTDSFVMNPHKWLLTNFDCTAFWVKNRKYLINSLKIDPEYLTNPEYSNTNEIIDYRDWQIQLRRSFRSLKLWFVLRYYGIEGIQNHIRSTIALSQRFLMKIKENPKFELVCDPFLSMFNFRLKNCDNSINEKFYVELNKSLKIKVSHCLLDDKYSIRVVVGNPLTEPRHIDESFEFIKLTSEKFVRSH